MAYTNNQNAGGLETLTSLDSGDLIIVGDISDSNRAKAITNANLLSSKADLASPTFTGTPSLPTGTTGVTQSASDNSTKLATTAYVDNQISVSGTTATFFVNRSICPTGASRTITTSSNTTAYFWAFELPFDITVNYISFSAFSGGSTETTFDIAVYSYDGQTKLFEVTTATTAGSAVMETAVSSVALSAGNYYLALVPNTNGSTEGFYSTDLIENAWSNLNGYDLTSQPKLAGTATVTAGTLPSTFNPVSGLTEISATAGGWLPFRLDN